jgi:TPR repeat protein
VHAQYRLGLLYFSGVGTPINKELGISYLTNASLCGNKDAMYAMGILNKSENRAESLERSYYWLTMSLNFGNDKAKNEVELILRDWKISKEQKDKVRQAALNAADSIREIAKSHSTCLPLTFKNIP